MRVYPYTGRDLFSRPERYFFAECGDEGFLPSWRSARHRAAEALARRCGESVPQPPAIQAGALAPGERSLDEVLRESLRLLRADATMARRGLEQLLPFLRRFEIYRRLYDRYGCDGRKARGARLASTGSYVLLAEGLASAAAVLDDLRCLSALLKLTDALTSLPAEQLHPRDAVVLLEILSQEDQLVRDWERR